MVVYGLNMDLVPKMEKKCVRYNRKFVISKLVITEFHCSCPLDKNLNKKVIFEKFLKWLLNNL